MTVEFGSAEWVTAVQTVLNQDQHFAIAASEWDSDVLFVCENVADSADPIRMYFELRSGKCQQAMQVDGITQQTDFLLIGELEIWQRVLSGQLNPVHAMMSRQIKLEGPMERIIRNPSAPVAMVQAVMQVDTSWPS